MPTLTIDWERSPRIIIVEQPDTEISAQQIVDLCRDAEDEPDNTGYPKLLNASGKEDLGGGTSVGITVEMQNAKIGFDDRTNKLETGTVTTPDTTGVTLTDSTALFETNLVEIGDLVVNTTDGSHSTIVEVTSETSVLTTGLAGGTDNQFASADAYEVWEIIPCEITGGNVVAVDDVGADLDPLLPTFGVYAKVSKASTGTLSEQIDIQHASYDGSVHVDVTSSTTGDAYPAGNSANPVNNWPDAVIINSREGFDQYSVEKSTTLDSGEDYTDASFVGKSIIDTVLTIPAGTTLDKAEFFNVSIEGTLGDVTIMQNCFLGETNELFDVQGVIENCSIGPAKLTLGGVSTDIVRFVNCRGAGSQFSPPTINCGGNGPEIDIQDYVGQLNIENKTGTAVFEISITGKLTLDSTVTDGVIIVNGAGTLEDNSGTGVTVINNMIQGIHLQELWKVQGLEFGNPMTVTQSSRSTQDQSVSLLLTGDGVTTQTVTRTTDQTITFDVPLVADLLDDSDFNLTPTFSRGTTGTYLDKTTGLIMSEAVDTPRFELGGLLVEQATTNLLLQNADYSTTWINQNGTVITTNTHTAPDGLTTADTIEDTSAVVAPYLRQQPTVAADSTIYSNSVYIRKTTAATGFPTYEIYMVTGAVFHQTMFNTDTGTPAQRIGGPVSGTSHGVTVDDVGDYWRLTQFFTNSGGTTIRDGHYPAVNDDAGTTFSVTALAAQVQWGAQLEDGPGTSVILNTTSQGTRDADFLSYNDDAVVIDSQGSIYVELTPLFNASYPNEAVIVNIADQLTGPMYIVDDTTQKIAISDGTNTATLDPSFIRGTTFKCAVRWNATENEMQVIVNGTAGTASSYDGSFVRTLGTLYVGSDSTGNHFNGNIRNLKIYSIDRGTDQLKVDTG